MEGVRVNAADMYAASKSLSEAYAAVMAPLARETGLAGTAVDILLFLANNPGKDTGSNQCNSFKSTFCTAPPIPFDQHTNNANADTNHILICQPEFGRRSSLAPIFAFLFDICFFLSLFS